MYISTAVTASTGLDPNTDLLLGISMCTLCTQTKQYYMTWCPIRPIAPLDYVMHKIQIFNTLMTLKNRPDLQLPLTQKDLQIAQPLVTVKKIIQQPDLAVSYNQYTLKMARQILQPRKWILLQPLLQQLDPQLTYKRVVDIAKQFNLYINCNEQTYNDVRTNMQARLLLKLFLYVIKQLPNNQPELACNNYEY